MKIPDFPVPGLTRYLIDLAKDREDLVKQFLQKNTANHSVLLISPSGYVFEVKVSDAGVVTATQVSG